MSTTTKTPGDVLMLAAINCQHSIEVNTIMLRADATGGTALNQLKLRLESALPRAIAKMVPSAEPIENATLNAALALARTKAKDKRAAAGFDGRSDDGGAGHLEALCSAYEAGLRGLTPVFLGEFLAQAKREADPEYAQYQRLHAKFGGKA